MTYPLMPRGVAVWLVENTMLTFDQIAEFCGIHRLEIQAIADSEQRMCSVDPIVQGELTLEEIRRCEADITQKLTLKIKDQFLKKKKGSKYVPCSKRSDRPDGISWVLKYYPDAPENAISKLLGTTPTTIKAIKAKTHWNMANIRPKDPVHLGLCSQEEFDLFVKKL